MAKIGMGRIDGLTEADARGPMQFLPTTWAKPGIGKGGDICDPRTYTGLYHWQIHYAAAGGVLWLPLGTNQNKPVAVATLLKQLPASAPPPGSSGY